jgi:hypothetical protein
LTLVSKYLSEIASTDGTIWMVSMVCEREQQIGGGQIKDIRRRSRDETQRGVYMGIYDADKHDRENTHPRRGRTSGLSCFLQVCFFSSQI